MIVGPEAGEIFVHTSRRFLSFPVKHFCLLKPVPYLPKVILLNFTVVGPFDLIGDLCNIINVC